MVISINNVLSSEDINYLLNIPEVLTAKNKIDNLYNNTSGSVYFSIPLTPSIKSTINQKIGLDLSNVKSIPMRWIKGDTLPHIDRGINNFENTYLMYLTDSSGELIVDNESYPIEKNHAYIFNEGLDHKTINTGINNNYEPRLLLGPMSEKAFAVGAATTISAPGGTTVNIKYTALNGLQFTYDNIEWIGMSTPFNVENTNTAAGILKIVFITDISLFTPNSYFICNTSKIQFGSETLNNDGTRPIITINGNEGDNYPGLIRNGTIGDAGYDDIYVFNLDVRNVGSTLETGGGWVAQSFFGKGGGPGNATINNYIINCSSNGSINEFGGGIVGSSAGNFNGSLTVIGCSSSGNININAGGIIGSEAAINGGTITINSCWSSGNIDDAAGGIIGSEAADSLAADTTTVTITNCYSEGNITGASAGGICGIDPTLHGGTINISNCYSIGDITGTNSGGIVGEVDNSGPNNIGNIVVSNCYTTGAINSNNQAGGICGVLTNNPNININHCYVAGSISAGGIDGYIIGNSDFIDGIDGDIVVSNCYVEALDADDGWDSGNANTVLNGFPTGSIGTTWISKGVNIPYELYNMGYTPYDATNITGSPPNLVRTETLTVAKTETATAGLKNAFYAILYIVEDNNGITINETTGAISTTTSTDTGTYTIYIYNSGSYNITTLTLTVGELPCLTEDTTVLTPKGYINVGRLRKGDNVITSDNRIVEIVKIYKSRVIGSNLTYPCIVPKNSIGTNYPPETFKISQGHLIRYSNSKIIYWIYPRKYFKLDKSQQLIKYYHIKLDNYITDHLVINNGVVVESLGNHPSDKPNNKQYYDNIKESKLRLRKKYLKLKKISKISKISKIL